MDAKTLGFFGLLMVAFLLGAIMEKANLRPDPAPVDTTIQADTTLTATQHDMVDSVQALMERVGWRVRCYTVLLSGDGWNPGGVNFTVEVDTTGGK